jgi:hypothetical protein
VVVDTCKPSTQGAENGDPKFEVSLATEQDPVSKIKHCSGTKIAPTQ